MTAPDPSVCPAHSGLQAGIQHLTELLAGAGKKLDHLVEGQSRLERSLGERMAVVERDAQDLKEDLAQETLERKADVDKLWGRMWKVALTLASLSATVAAWVAMK